MLKAGDSVKVVNVAQVGRGEHYFNEGDVTQVQAVVPFIPGLDLVFVKVTRNADDPRIRGEGIDDQALLFSPEEVKKNLKKV